MVERQEVETLLASVDYGDPWWFTKTEMVVIADLCRAWLAVKDAPVATASRSGQRVRIVKEVEGLSGSGLT